MTEFDETKGLTPMTISSEAWAELLPPEKEVIPAPVVVLPNLKDIYILSSVDPRSRNELNRSFTNIALDCVSEFSHMGFHRDLSSILKKMIKETSMVVVSSRDAENESSANHESDFVVLRPDRNPNTDLEEPAERVFCVNPAQLELDAEFLGSVLNSSIPNLQPRKAEELRMLSLEWLIGRKVMELANTATYLQNNYGGFREAFGGYTPHYLTRRTIALKYLEGNHLEPEVCNEPDIETERIIEGFGLHYLKKTILRRNIVLSECDAELVVQNIVMPKRRRLFTQSKVSFRDIACASPYSTEDLIVRLANTQPVPEAKYCWQVMIALSKAVEAQLERQ